MERSSFIPRSYSKSELAMLIQSQHHAQGSRPQAQPLDSLQARTPGTACRHRHASQCQVLHSYSSARHRRSIGRTVTSKNPSV